MDKVLCLYANSSDNDNDNVNKLFLLSKTQKHTFQL